MKKNISKKEYRDFVKGLTIKEIKMISLNATVKKDFGPPANIMIKDNAKLEIINDNSIEVIQTYNIDAKKEKEENPGLQVEITYLLKYSIKTPIKNGYFDVFKNSSLRLHSWPYVRQLIHQITFNMNIPPIILGAIAI